MTIRKKTLLCLFCLAMVMIAALAVLSETVLMRGFAKLEADSVRLNTRQAIGEINQLTARMESAVNDYAPWDDSYRFVQDRNKAYVQSNLQDDTLVNLNINFMLYIGSDGKTAFQKYVDLEQGKQVPLPQPLWTALSARPHLLGHRRLDDMISGLIMVDDRPVVVASQAIIKSDGSGPVAGTLVVGRYLDRQAVDQLAAIVHLNLTIYPLNGSRLPLPLADVAHRWKEGDAPLVRVAGKHAITGNAIITDIDGAPAILVKVTMDRGIYAQGRRSLNTFLAAMAITCLVVTGVLMALLEKGILAPLGRLSQNVRQVDRTDRHLPVIEMDRSDELGQLSADIDAMVAQLWEKGDLLRKTNRQLTSDIHQRIETEKALVQSEARYRHILEAAPGAIAIAAGSEGRLIEVNQAFVDITGHGKDEVIGKTPDELNMFVAEGQREWLQRLFKSRGRLDQVPVQCRAKDGQVRDILLSARQMKQGELNCQVAAFADVTDLKQAEREKQQLAAQLQRSQKMEAVGTLAGGVAHDLNNVLSGVVSLPDLLLADLDADSPMRRALLTIQRSGQKATAIVQDLLTLARRGVAVTRVVNLNQVIKEYLASPEFQKLSYFHPQVEVKAELADDLLNLVGSSVHLGKTVMNLVSNAAEAMPDGGTVRIATENCYVDRPLRRYDHVEQGEYTLLTVEDSGIGIRAEDQERIFEPFYTKKEMGRSGTGLGMAVVWGTVKDHYGYIDLESTEGKGTIFKLYFPATRQVLAGEKVQPTVDALRGRGQSILVVDDVAEQRQICSSMLERLGYRVSAVDSGEAAIAYFKNHPVDLVILDMIMAPGMDGLDTYQAMCEMNAGQKALLVSGYSETDRVRAAQQLGAGEYIRKPYTLDRIGAAVLEALAA